MKKLWAAALFISIFFVSSSWCSAEENVETIEMRSQLTIYVASPLLEDGGTVIVVSNPVTLDRWRNIPQGDNPAHNDPQNEKKNDIREGDRLFGAVVSTKVAIVEFPYPEGGTFGFNLVPMRSPNSSDAHSIKLNTKRVLIGDGGYKDWKTGKEYLWESVSTIHIVGPEVSEADSRSASVAEAEIMNLPPRKIEYEGTTVYAPSAEQLDKLLVKIPE